MSKTEIPAQASTILNQDAINEAGMPPRLGAPDRPIKPFSLAYWLRVADKAIILQSARRASIEGKRLAILG
jgi:hypothetical protein